MKGIKMNIEYIFNKTLQNFHALNNIHYEIINNKIFIVTSENRKYNSELIIIKKPKTCNNCKYFSICNLIKGINGKYCTSKQCEKGFYKGDEN